jgi:hypothetical protein
MNQFNEGQRVVLRLHGERNYATVVADGSKPESIMLNVDGRYHNPQEHWRHNVVPAIAARDMAIGDLLNLQMLKDVIETPFLGTLWTHGDSGMLTPYVCECSFGDGMGLLCLYTISQRPNYHVVRVDSTWEANDVVGENIEDILTAIENECGNARCGYSGSSLRWPREERIENCQCEECDDEYVSVWPEIDANIGCSWRWYRWDELIREIGIENLYRRTPA